jgi:hypothetical protein
MRGEAAGRGGVDDEQHLPAVLRQRVGRAVRGGGDWQRSAMPRIGQPWAGTRAAVPVSASARDEGRRTGGRGRWSSPPYAPVRRPSSRAEADTGTAARVPAQGWPGRGEGGGVDAPRPRSLPRTAMPAEGGASQPVRRTGSATRLPRRAWPCEGGCGAEGRLRPHPPPAPLRDRHHAADRPTLGRNAGCRSRVRLRARRRAADWGIRRR